MTHPSEVARLFDMAAGEAQALLALEEGLDAIHEGIRILRTSREAKQRLAGCTGDELRAALALRSLREPSSP